jgi:hypothetical protein
VRARGGADGHAVAHDDRPPWPTPRKRCAQSERRALMVDASLARLVRAAVRNAS